MVFAGRCAYPGPPPDNETTEFIRRQCLDKRKKPNPAQLLDDHCFVVFDTETTGFAHRGGDEIISVGAVKVERGQIQTVKSFHRLVNPFRSIPPEVVTLTGITQDMVEGQDDVFSVLSEFLEYTGDSILIGHYVTFDLDFVNEKLRLCNSKLHSSYLDTCVISKAVYPHRSSHSLDSLLKVHGIDAAGRHTALGDALLTARLFEDLIGQCRRRGVYTLGDLQAFVQQQMDYYYQGGFSF
ncbi:MAG: exonuclease domain-containing protein [Eubacteriales bacterium]|nr:3'-5' exonuclease [Bacillota bacterium]MBV1727364.1 3'-5' exonuclease [Desulforudis sp.]MDQ7790325.1 exonuclease domain-containing protein [Clostridia bacterium]MDZ4043487.1 exonuclease domain-containing protein [Eubacteriales bacterium]MBU4533495.1 3'-5' exonuclease [Bacillota bacterium]